MNKTALPPDPLLGAIADVLVHEERQRESADREIAADLARLRERIDEYGNVIETRFAALDIRIREQLAAQVAAIALPAGAKGDQGEPGAVGERGPPGEPGPIGERGEPGERGEGGAPGAPGARGDAGAPGEKGERGEPGQDGAPGQPGIAGERGEKGDRGDPGERGEKGDAAYTGRALGRWTPDGMKYRAMDVVAHNGSEWRAVTDDPGPLPGDGWMLSAKGVKGDKGVPGDRGEKGERGLPGPAGRGVDDILIDNGVLVFVLSDGQRREFVLEQS